MHMAFEFEMVMFETGVNRVALSQAFLRSFTHPAHIFVFF